MGRTKDLFQKNKEENENNRDDYIEIMYNEKYRKTVTIGF